jgi:predicted transglutaminase-like cysteine proteinase
MERGWGDVPGEGAEIARRRGRRIATATLAALIMAAAGTAAVEARRKPAEAQPVFTAPVALFGQLGTEHPPARNFAKWIDVLARYERERKSERDLCRRGDCALVNWRGFLAGLKRGDRMTQLRAVNAYINRVPYKTDQELYGADDYWASPRELFAKGGDCEDYAIAKYLSLRALGWPAERLRIVVVNDRARDLVHAALIAYHDGGAYLLDIEITEVIEQGRVDRYVPIFAISESGWWSYQPGERIVTQTDPARPQDAENARAAVKAAVQPPQTSSPPLRPAQNEPGDGDEEDDEDGNVPHTPEPGERLEEVFLPSAQ